MSQIHQQLKSSLLEFEQLQKVQKHLDSLKHRLKKESGSLKHLEKKLKKEERDVKLLEKTSMRSLFHKILGDQEEQLEKERQEYLQVALRYNELVKSIDVVAYEIGILEKKLVKFDDVSLAVEKLMKMREKELLRTDPVIGEELLFISKSIDHNHIVSRNLEEAIQTGNAALKYLKSMERHLNQARNWGQWDMAGSRSHGSYMKHLSIDKARDLSYKSKHVLLRFREELQDVYDYVQIDVRIEMQDFGRFTDIFFDNLISDWIVQQKIKNALKNVVFVKRQVESALAQMKREIPKIEEETETLEIRREETILQSEK